MSGHSKWHSIKHKKGLADAKKGAIFSKMSKNIAIAARGGADPEMNFKLRMAIAAAKAANLPKDNIERAIAKGAGGGDGSQIEEVVYEGLGPDNIPVIIKVLTDNKNRASQSLKHLFTKFGGTLGAPVMWQFDLKGVIHISAEALAGKNYDELEMQFIDLGVQDIKKSEAGLSLICDIENLQKVIMGLEKLGLTADSAEPEYVPKNPVKATPEIINLIQSLLDALDEDEDVDNYYTNIEE